MASNSTDAVSVCKKNPNGRNFISTQKDRKRVGENNIILHMRKYGES